MSNAKFNFLAEEIGKHEMIRLCRSFLIDNRALSKELTAEEALDPSNCPLHHMMMTGSLCYTQSQNGEYPDNAPPCNGCSVGITEAAKEGISAAEEEYGHEQENFLPCGAHLLPEEFKDVLRAMHMDIQEKVGYWFNHENSRVFKELYPKTYSLHKKAISHMREKYPDAFAACKAYQAEEMAKGNALNISGEIPDYMIRKTCVTPYNCYCDKCTYEERMERAQMEYQEEEAIY